MLQYHCGPPESAQSGHYKTIVSDNGPQFTSELFWDFCGKRTITHLTTAPYHPMINGLAERFVDTFKRAMSKLGGYDYEAIHEFLRDYRATSHPAAPNGESPAELFFGRKMRLPLDSLQPPQEHSSARNEKMEAEYNRKHGAKERLFAVGERIAARVGPKSTWQPYCGNRADRVRHV